MLIERVSIERFRRFGDPPLTFDVTDGTEPLRRFMILGDNGSGKTTVLQAIALCLSMAQGKTKTIDDFRWSGWTPSRLSRRGDPLVEVTVRFTETEIAATQVLAQRWWDLTRPLDRAGFVPPGDDTTVTYRLAGTRIIADPRHLFQLRGRAYAAPLLRRDPEARRLIEMVPGVFWYDQHRSITLPVTDDESTPTEAHADERAGQLNAVLVSWHARNQNYVSELEALYKTLFPSYRFAGLEDRWGDAPTPVGTDVVFGDGERTWTLAEMSGGEQAIFPILFELVRQRVHQSVVIIDELDLNLHPPLAQLLVSALPRLGKGNQFLFTTHAQTVSSVVGPEATLRLPGGRLCL